MAVCNAFCLVSGFLWVHGGAPLSADFGIWGAVFLIVAAICTIAMAVAKDVTKRAQSLRRNSRSNPFPVVSAKL